MEYLVGGLYGFVLGVVILMTLGGILVNAAYSNGFWDGLHWARDPSWPSRPGKRWWGWKRLDPEQ